LEFKAEDIQENWKLCYKRRVKILIDNFVMKIKCLILKTAPSKRYYSRRKKE
jgi:hypothetical protein